MRQTPTLTLNSHRLNPSKEVQGGQANVTLNHRMRQLLTNNNLVASQFLFSPIAGNIIPSLSSSVINKIDIA